MTHQQIRFEDGAAYEQMMGVWSRLVGETFLEWLAPPAGLQWIDVGCGNGAFTELLIKRCAPTGVVGIDPSEGQLAYARSRPGAGMAKFHVGDAMALSFPDDAFDAAVMALVIFFVPNPGAAVAEMARVVRPGGILATYAWDMLGGGFPLEPIMAEMRAMGLTPPRPPQAAASRMEALAGLWADAGCQAVETRQILVERPFVDFEDYWTIALKSSSLGPALAAMAPAQAEMLKQRVRTRLDIDTAGRVLHRACANAVKGRLPQ